MQKANKYMKFKFCTKQIDTKCKLKKCENNKPERCVHCWGVHCAVWSSDVVL